MFVYQDGQMYFERGDILVGVDITPTGISENGITDTYRDGSMYTLENLYVVFGKDCTFVHKKAGVENDTTGKDETPAGNRRGRPRRSV